MQDLEQNNKNEFVIERIKERPVNRKKLVRRSFMTAAMAVLFGLISCVTFLVLEPVLSNWLYPQEEPTVVLFPQEQDEMQPKDMLSDNLSAEPTPEPMYSTPVFSSGFDMQTEELEKMLEHISWDVDAYSQLYTALGAFVKDMNRYMVTVTARSSKTDWLQNVTESQNYGTGVVIGNTGRELLILTNYSYLKKADSLQVEFSNGAVAEAQVKQQHTATDVVILSVSRNTLGIQLDTIPIAVFGSSTQSLLCTPVIAMGNPLGEQGSVGYGMITSETGQVTMVDGNYKLLMTDIYGSQNATGFLFNLRGQIIGMITTPNKNAELKNMITAYGITDLKKIISNLSKGTPIAYLGITGLDVSREANVQGQVPRGVYVKDVEMNSPAMQAGVQPGDIIVGIGNTVVSQFNEYFNAITNLEGGNVIKMKIMRQFQQEYKEMEFNITVGEAN